jgi:hypothetical protein
MRQDALLLSLLSLLSLLGLLSVGVASVERGAVKRWLDQLESADRGEEVAIDPSAEPEARMMRMADRNFAPANNVQTSVDAEHALIVGQKVTTEATDNRSLLPIAEAAKQALGAETLNVVADTPPWPLRGTSIRRRPPIRPSPGLPSVPRPPTRLQHGLPHRHACGRTRRWIRDPAPDAPAATSHPHCGGTPLPDAATSESAAGIRTVQLQKIRRIVPRPTRLRRLATQETQLSHIQSPHEQLDHPAQVIVRNQIVQRRGKQRLLPPRLPLV